ncbi:MAG: serine hydrolase domain-containing protein [Ignavibacteria bacterium]|nr:MAG: serine hydrolase domain-containing protein [Ignavibacteria bacterium]
MNNLILKYLLPTFLLALLFVFNVFCQDDNHQNNRYDFTNIDEIIQSAITDSAFPGAVILVSRGGKIIYEKAFGHLTYDDSSAIVTTNTIYDIASLTKVIATTTAAMICYDRNLFDIDDPVSNYIPEFARNGKENVTIKNLLLHNSGLPSFKPFYKKYSSPDEVISDIYSTPLQYQPGTKTVYSDLGIIILAKVIEKVTGKSLDDFSQEEIFKPLEISSTYFNPPDSLKYKIAPTEYDDYWRNKLVWGKVHDETAFMLNGVAGHAGLFSTASDISHLLLMLLNKGNYNSKQIIKGKTIQLFTKRYSQQSTRALGWDTKSNTGSSAGDLFDSTSFGHLGFTGTSVWVDPTRNLFVIFLTNRVYPTRENKKLYKVRPALHNAIIKAIE